jgi:hypothetical protein
VQRLAYRPVKPEVAGSNPVAPASPSENSAEAPTKKAISGGVVQRLAYRPVKPEVAGSNPVAPARDMKEKWFMSLPKKEVAVRL